MPCRVKRFLAYFLFWVTRILFWIMPFWIVISSFFTFMAGLFLVPFYIPIWIILRMCCRVLLKHIQVMDTSVNKSIHKLESAIRLNSRALKYNLYLSLPVSILFLGYMVGRHKN